MNYSRYIIALLPDVAKNIQKFKGMFYGPAVYTVFQKKTPTHITGYKLKNSCLILIILTPHLTYVSTLPCKTHHTSFVAVHYNLQTCFVL